MRTQAQITEHLPAETVHQHHNAQTKARSGTSHKCSRTSPFCRGFPGREKPALVTRNGEPLWVGGFSRCNIACPKRAAASRAIE